MNVAICIGNLTRDPELRFTQSGMPMCRFTVAVNRYAKNKDGTPGNETTFIPVVVWDKQAENCDRYLKKGRKVAVQGRMSIRNYDDKEGKKRTAFEIVAERVDFLSSRTEEGGAEAGSAFPAGGEGTAPGVGGAGGIPEDGGQTEHDIPF